MTLVAWERDAFNQGTDWSLEGGALVRRYAEGTPRSAWSPPVAVPGYAYARDHIHAFVGRLLRASRPGRLRRIGLQPEDLVQMGMEGFVQASQRFKPGGGASFKTYSEHRIVGAIKDGLDEADRRRRRGLGHDETELKLLSLDGLDPAADSPRTLAEAVPDRSAGVDDADAYLDLVRGLSRLDERERWVLLHQGAGYRLHELAPALGVSMMRVSQISTEAKRKLRGWE
jgi:RNA polymerase sigma factor (sigma-70 family)